MPVGDEVRARRVGRRRGPPERRAGHADALRRCTPLFKGADEIVVPVHFDAEVASALLRRGTPDALVDRVLQGVLSSRTVVTLGPRATRATISILKKTRLRAADAFYVWLAAREGIPLVTADAEILQRGGAICQVLPP